MSKIDVGQSFNFNPANAEPESDGFTPGVFSAKVKIVSSRYVKMTYNDVTFAPKIGIEWKMLSVNNKEFTKTYSTGLKFDELAEISADGKRLISKSEDFKGFRYNSDGMHLLESAIKAGFPSDKITNDMSVFEGAVFLIEDGVNPRWTSSSKKSYPKKYITQDWNSVIATAQAKKAAQQQEGTTQYQAAAKTSPVEIASNILIKATEVLTQLVTDSPSKKLSRTDIPAAINTKVPDIGNWAPGLQQQVMIALWNIDSLTTVVTNAGILKLDGDTIYTI